MSKGERGGRDRGGAKGGGAKGGGDRGRSGGKAGGGKAGGGKAGGGKAGGGGAKAGGAKAGGAKAGGANRAPAMGRAAPKAGGAKAAAAPKSTTTTRTFSGSGAPVVGKFAVTSPFGTRQNPTAPGKQQHKGVDISMPVGTQVRAPVSGTVIKATWENAKNHKQGFGQEVKIDAGNGKQVTLGHLSQIDVKKGDRVTAGDPVGKSGNTGRTTGPHLHFEVRQDGKPVDPLRK